MSTTAAVPLSAPLYGANPLQAIGRYFRKYGVFSGRASRAEYWWIALFNVVVLAVLGGLAIGLGVATGRPSATGDGVYLGDGGAVGGILVGIWFLATFVPGLAVTVRRLHDANFSGFLILLNLIPSVGPIIVLVLTILPPNALGARFDAPATAPPVVAN